MAFVVWCRCVEEALVSAFTEARRSAPAVIYWPQVNTPSHSTLQTLPVCVVYSYLPRHACLLFLFAMHLFGLLLNTFQTNAKLPRICLAALQAHLWWAAAGSGLRCALVALLDDLPADLPLMLLATAELPPTDPAAAAASTLPGSSSRLLLPAGATPTAAAAAAAGVRSSPRGLAGPSSSCGSKQQQDVLEELGMDPTLAALFPALGRLSDLQGLLQGLQKQVSTSAAQEGQPQDPQRQQEGPQQEQAQQGCDALGWVLLGKPGPAERRKMFKVR